MINANYIHIPSPTREPRLHLRVVSIPCGSYTYILRRPHPAMAPARYRWWDGRPSLETTSGVSSRVDSHIASGSVASDTKSPMAQQCTMRYLCDSYTWIRSRNCFLATKSSSTKSHTSGLSVSRIFRWLRPVACVVTFSAFCDERKIM